MTAEQLREPVAWIVSATEAIPYPHIERLTDVGQFSSGTKLYAHYPAAHADALEELERLKRDLGIMTKRADNEERATERAERAEAELAKLKAQIKQMEKDHRDDLRSATAEASRAERVPDEPYGTY